jgi:redox-sensitive bicupin YhaK (pirin superfamily)
MLGYIYPSCRINNVNGVIRMRATIIKPQDQAIGQFDGGKIIEQKPIGFPGEGSRIHRLGPLFYWAWAHSSEPAEIGLHPHQGFEIITYVIKGNAYHRDTLGTESVVGEGGAQLMQTGSGVQHAETLKQPSEIFQIWIEPHLSKAITRTPTYSQYSSDDFSVSIQDGVTIATILGNDSPMNIVADAAMWDICIPRDTAYSHNLLPNRTIAGLAIRGDGDIIVNAEGPTQFEHKDFVVVESDQGGEVTIKAIGEELRIFLIEVPTEVGYPLYSRTR